MVMKIISLLQYSRIQKQQLHCNFILETMKSERGEKRDAQLHMTIKALLNKTTKKTFYSLFIYLLLFNILLVVFINGFRIFIYYTTSQEVMLSNSRLYCLFFSGHPVSEIIRSFYKVPILYFFCIIFI